METSSEYAHRIVHMWRQTLFLKHRGVTDGEPCSDTIVHEDRFCDVPGLDVGDSVQPGSAFIYVMTLWRGGTYLLGGFPYEYWEYWDQHDSESADWGNFHPQSNPDDASLFRSDVVVPLPTLQAITAWRGRGSHREVRPLVFRTDDAGRPNALDAQTMRHPTLLASGWEGLDALLDWP